MSISNGLVPISEEDYNDIVSALAFMSFEPAWEEDVHCFTPTQIDWLFEAIEHYKQLQSC